MTTKRKVTENDLGLHPQLGERGVNVGDDQSFSIDGFPVFDEAGEEVADKVSDEDGGSAGADASGEGVEREITDEDLKKYPALSNAGAMVGDKWPFDTGNGDPIFYSGDGGNKRLITVEDLAKFPELGEKGLTIEDELEFDADGNPVLPVVSE